MPRAGGVAQYIVLGSTVCKGCIRGRIVLLGRGDQFNGRMVLLNSRWGLYQGGLELPREVKG